jgi:hypothetical protein
MEFRFRVRLGISTEFRSRAKAGRCGAPGIFAFSEWLCVVVPLLFGALKYR